MYDSSSKTLFIGKKILYLPSCHSTNDIAAELVHQSNVSEGAIVITDEQTAGRGQRGTRWETNRGQNFTLSVVLKPTFLAITDQFLLSQAVALGIRNYVSNYAGNAYIKWPNDLYVNNLKIGGILIENSIQGSRIAHSIVGIGLNINQTDFRMGRASSLRLETGHWYDLREQLPLLLHSLENTYLRLRQGQVDSLRQDYLSVLLGYGQKRLFQSRGRQFEGEVRGVAPSGQLLVQLTGDSLTAFDIKEIEWLWED